MFLRFYCDTFIYALIYLLILDVFIIYLFIAYLIY